MFVCSLAVGLLCQSASRHVSYPEDFFSSLKYCSPVARLPTMVKTDPDNGLQEPKGSYYESQACEKYRYLYPKICRGRLNPIVVHSVFIDVNFSSRKTSPWKRNLIEGGKLENGISGWRILSWYLSTTCRRGVGNLNFAFAVHFPLSLTSGTSLSHWFLLRDYHRDL